MNIDQPALSLSNAIKQGLDTGSDRDALVNDLDQLRQQGGLYRGNVNIISGVHGFPNGSTQAARDLFDADVLRFGSISGVRVFNFPDMAPLEITNLLRGEGTTIGGFCDSGACLAPFK